MASDEEKEKFELMEKRDEDQIQKAVLGEYLEEFIYDFKTKSGHRVTGLSWVGVKEIAARMGHIRCDEKPDIRDQGDSWVVMVKAEDRLRDSSRWGITTQSKKMKLRDGGVIDDEFAIQKAMSKAQRNAIRQLIPEKWIQLLIDKFLGGEKRFEPEKVIDMKSGPAEKAIDVKGEGKILSPTPSDVEVAVGKIYPEKPGIGPKGHLSQNKLCALESPERTTQSRASTANQAANITAMCRKYRTEFGYDPIDDILDKNGVGHLQALTFEQAEAAIRWLGGL